MSWATSQMVGEASRADDSRAWSREEGWNPHEFSWLRLDGHDPWHRAGHLRALLEADRSLEPHRPPVRFHADPVPSGLPVRGQRDPYSRGQGTVPPGLARDLRGRELEPG